MANSAVSLRAPVTAVLVRLGLGTTARSCTRLAHRRSPTLIRISWPVTEVAVARAVLPLRCRMPRRRPLATSLARDCPSVWTAAATLGRAPFANAENDPGVWPAVTATEGCLKRTLQTWKQHKSNDNAACNISTPSSGISTTSRQNKCAQLHLASPRSAVACQVRHRNHVSVQL